MTNYKNYLLIVLFLLFAGSLAVRAQDMVTIYPNEYPNALRNPLKGFRVNLSDADDSQYIYTSIVRDYIRWNQIENSASDGVQKIIDFCNQRWEGLEEMNIKVIPRVYLDWDSNPGNEYWPADLTDGDWTSQEFKDRVVNLIAKLGEAWDNDPRVAWVQTGIIGYWGEQENPVGVDEDGWATRMGTAFDAAFQNKQLLVRNQRRWDPYGFEYGGYWDSYGHPGQTNGSWADIRNTNSQGRYLTEVVEGEVAYNWGEDKFDPLYGGEPEITLSNTTYANNMMDVIRELHCTGLGWISKYLDINSGLIVNIDTIKANADRMQKVFGYRYIIPEFSCATRVDQSGTMDISFKVKNTGSAPFYHSWPVALTLIDQSSRQIIWTEEIPGVDITQWLPGDHFNYDTRVYDTPAPEYQIDASFTVPANIPTGQYMVGIAIIDPSTQLPGIFFAVENFLAESQSHPLCRIGIGEELDGAPEIDPAIFGDPLENDTRFYKSTKTSNVQITYPSDGAGFSPPATVPVYVTAFKNEGSIDSVELYVDGNLESTLYSSPYFFSVPDLSVGIYTVTVRAYDDEGAILTDQISVNVQIPGGLPWIEKFDLPNGTKSDAGETAWTSSRGGGTFEVNNGVFAVSDGKTFIGELMTEVMDISAAPVTVSLEVEALSSGLDTGEDYVKLFKIVDGGTEVLIDMVDGNESKTLTESNITGNTLQLVIRGYTTFNTELYEFDNLSVTYDVEVPTKDITIVVNGSGTVDPSEGIHSYYEGQTLILTAIPAFGFEFDSWSGDLTGTENPVTITMDTDKNIVALFVEIPSYALTVTAENGSVSMDPAVGSYLEGTEVTLSATPDPGYEFEGWSGDLSGIENPVTLTMDADKNITAVFSEIPTYTMSITAENGSVSMDPDADAYMYGTEVTLTASPDAGYEFNEWSGDVSGTTNPVTITVNGDMNITANFELIISVRLLEELEETNLGQNYPNPFSSHTTIPYHLSTASHVNLGIFNMLGECVAILVNDCLAAGSYLIDWNVSDHGWKEAPGGIYIYRLETDHQVFMKKLMFGQ